MNRGWPKGLGHRRGSYNVTQEQQRWQENVGWGWQFRQLQNGGSETRQALPQSTGASVQHSHLEDAWGWGNRNGSNWQSGEDWRTTNHQGPNAINRGHSFDRGSSGTSAQPSYPLSEHHWQSGNPGASWNLAQQHQYLNSLPNDCFQQRFLQPIPSLDDWQELPFHNSSMLTWKDMDDMGLGMIRFESSNQFQSRCQAQGKGKAIQVGQDVKSKNKRLQGQSDGPNMDRNKIFQSLKAAGTGIKETTKGQMDKVKNHFKPKSKEEPFEKIRNLKPDRCQAQRKGEAIQVSQEVNVGAPKNKMVKQLLKKKCESSFSADADFLAKCTGGSDVKPGLQKTKAQQREHQKAMKRIANHEEMQRNKKIRRNINEIEVDKREEGLAQSIAEPSNKGFAMLAKMGYKAGSGLGKEGEGRLEPVGVEVKMGREGLGRDTALRELGEAKCRILEVRALCKPLDLIEMFRHGSVPW